MRNLRKEIYIDMIKKMKKTLGLFLALLMVVTLIPTAIATIEDADYPLADIIAEYPAEPGDDAYYGEYYGARMRINAPENELWDEITPATTYISIPFSQRPASDANEVASGAFPGVNGAPWRLYDDGTLVVGEGRVSNLANTLNVGNPSRSNSVNYIVFTAPVTLPISSGILETSVAFRTLPNVEHIRGLEYFNTSGIVQLNMLFAFTLNPSNLVSIGDVSNWNTSNMTHMDNLFYGASLTTLDVSGWDVSRVRFMNSMFNNVSSLVSLDLSNWNTSDVRDMRYMFAYASSLETLDVSGWDVGLVTRFERMFMNASSLQRLDLSSWNILPNANMQGMFSGTYNLRELTLGDNFTFNPSSFPQFQFGPNLPTPPINDRYTGFWINVGTGTVDNPHGPYLFSGPALMYNHNNNPEVPMNETWVWQRNFNVTYTVTGPAPANFTPAIPDAARHPERVVRLPDGAAMASIITVAPPLATTETTHNGVTGTWTFNGWNHATITGPTFTMPNSNVEFTGYWVFAPETLESLTVTYAVSGTRPAAYSGMPVSPQTAAAGAAVTVASIPTTTETTHNGVTGTWTFNGWNHATITGSTFTMPNSNVEFTGYWTFTPATGGNGGNPGGGTPGGGIPGGGTPGTGSGGGTPGQPGTGGTNPFSPYHNSFIIGRPSGNIYPGANMTRAEVTTIFLRLFSDDFRIQMWSQQNPFADVNSTDWFNNAISTVANAGIVHGRPDGTFQPNQPITRAEVAAITARFFEETGQTQGAFTDISGHWAEGYVNRLAQFGWVQGSGNGTFRPDDLITRAEVAAIVNRMLNRVLDSEDSLLDGRTRWPDKANMSAWYYLYLQEASHSTEFVRLMNGSLNWTDILSHIEWQLLERPDSRPYDVRVSRR